MVKSFHRLFYARSEREYETLVELFNSLGLIPREKWEGQRSRGVKLEAPESGVEIGSGEGFPNADLVIEVDNAEIVYEAVRQRKLKVVEEIEDFDWGARMFTVELPEQAG